MSSMSLDFLGSWDISKNMRYLSIPFSQDYNYLNVVVICMSYQTCTILQFSSRMLCLCSSSLFLDTPVGLN